MITRRSSLTLTCTAVAALLAGTASRAFGQVLSKNARMVVGFPAGGSTDVLARLLADRMRIKYAPVVIVENKAGAGGRLGADAVKNGDADGSQMLLSPCSILWIYPHVYKKLTYDTLRDFTPVTPVGTVGFGLCVGPAVPSTVKTIADYAQWAKADPKNASYGSPAAGATPHFIGVMLSRAIGVELNHVAYKGGAPALQDVMGGQIPASINVLSEVIPQLAGGRLRVLATSGVKRSRFLPDVPTFIEAGLKDVAAQEVFGVFLPSRTPADIVNKLHVVLKEIVNGNDFAEAIAKLSYEPAEEAPANFAKTVQKELSRWDPIVKASGFTAEE